MDKNSFSESFRRVCLLLKQGNRALRIRPPREEWSTITIGSLAPGNRRLVCIYRQRNGWFPLDASSSLQRTQLIQKTLNTEDNACIPRAKYIVGLSITVQKDFSWFQSDSSVFLSRTSKELELPFFNAANSKFTKSLNGLSHMQSSTAYFFVWRHVNRIESISIGQCWHVRF